MIYGRINQNRACWACMSAFVAVCYRQYIRGGDRMIQIIKIIKMLFCHHKFKFVRKLYGDEINAHNGKRNEYVCEKCGMYKWE